MSHYLVWQRLSITLITEGQALPHMICMGAGQTGTRGGLLARIYQGNAARGRLVEAAHRDVACSDGYGCDLFWVQAILIVGFRRDWVLHAAPDR